MCCGAWILLGLERNQNEQGLREGFQRSKRTWCVCVLNFCFQSVGNVIPPSAVTHGVKSLPGEPKVL
jgi:hypothetical protein